MAIYIGEDPPLSTNMPAILFDLGGFESDFINAEGLMKLKVQDGQPAPPIASSYRYLVIAPQVKYMSLPVISQVRALLADGALVVGKKPLDGTLSDMNKELREIYDELWGEQRGKVAMAWRKFGRGYLFSHMRHALEQKPLPRDVSSNALHLLRWTHRITPDADIYFLTNQSAQQFAGEVDFRVRGRNVELWNAVSGTRSPVSYRAGDQSTSVDLNLGPWSSIFVVFRGELAGDANLHFVVAPPHEVLTTLDGPWQVQFLDGRGAPERAQLAGSWSDHADPGIRFYSGRVRYQRRVRVPPEWLDSTRRIVLDLGDVREIAHVHVNGRDLGTLWGAPYRRDITDALRAGEILVEITVTNYWVNRLIGDEQPGARRYTFAPIQPYKADSPLRPSGLLGPVRIIGTTGERAQ